MWAEAVAAVAVSVAADEVAVVDEVAAGDNDLALLWTRTAKSAR